MAQVAVPAKADASRKFNRIETLLVERGVVTTEALVAAKDRQRGAKRPLVEVLVEQGAVNEELMASVLAEAAGVPLATAADLKPQADVQKLVPAELAQMGILPLRVENGTLVVAVIDPMQIMAFDELAVRTGLKVRPLVARRASCAAPCRARGRASSPSTTS